MDKLQLAIVGCGGMGHRHWHGLAELHRAGLCQFELVGACDPVRENAESLAAKAEEHFGKRPTVAVRLEELPESNAVDICADPRHHLVLTTGRIASQ